jgi:hypothetical protein
MNKLKIFLSSRVKSESNSDELDRQFTLGELRSHLLRELEKEKFLGEKVLDVVTNETDFDSPIARDAFDNCMTVMRSCNIIIILYNGEAGWGVTDNSSTNGICHEEFLVAVNEFSEMAFAINLSKYFRLADDDPNAKRNLGFADNVRDTFPSMVTPEVDTVENLKEFVLSQAKRYVLASVERSFATQKRLVAGSSVFGETLDWSKLSYPERHDKLKAKIESTFNVLPGFQDVVKAYYAVPDHMSVADARNRVGRPFLYEHTLVENVPQKSGVIHFVGVYGNTTEIQAKALVGYPDITVIRAPFGFYLWEKNVHIQIFFLKSCINPLTVGTRCSEVINWLAGSREQSRILKRAEARYSILEAVNRTKSMSGF